MNKYLKILCVQFVILIFGGLLIEFLFEMPEWLSIAIAGLIFFGVYFAIQIKSAIRTSSKEVSSDGIAGARLAGLLICSVLLAFILGIYVYQAANIIMLITGIGLLILKRKNIGFFFFENRWETGFWFIYIGCSFLICGLFSVFAYMDIAPCKGLQGGYRIIAIAIWAFIIVATLPPNTLLSRFATNNFARYENE